MVGHEHFHSVLLKCTLSHTLLPCLDADKHRAVLGKWSLTAKTLSCAPVCPTRSDPHWSDISSVFILSGYRGRMGQWDRHCWCQRGGSLSWRAAGFGTAAQSGNEDRGLSRRQSTASSPFCQRAESSPSGTAGCYFWCSRLSPVAGDVRLQESSAEIPSAEHTGTWPFLIRNW